MGLKPTELPVGAPDPTLLEYQWGFDVMWILDEDLEAIYEWLIENIGVRDKDWLYQFSFPEKYAAVYFKDVNQAMEFKLRWL